MLGKSIKLSKIEKKKMFEEYQRIQRENSKFENKYLNEPSVSSWDFVYYSMKYKSKD